MLHMRGLLARILITAFGLWMADSLLDGMSFGDMPSLWIAALLLGIVNAVVRPLVVILTFPITLITLGLFLLVINGAMLFLVAGMMPAFEISGIGTAMLGAIIVGLTGWVANGFVGNKGKVERWSAKR
jgi:putative membrane protein